MTIYLNHQIQNYIDPEVFEAMRSIYVHSTPHELDKAFSYIKQLVRADFEDTFMLTHSGAEAINHVIQGVYLDITRKTGKNHFITTNLGEAPIILSFARLEQLGCVTKIVPANSNGYISEEAIIESITPRTACISLSIANGLTGVIQPIEKIAEVCKERGIFLHLDISYALPSMECNFYQLGANALTFDGEKIHGPIGSGGIFYSKETFLSPLILGKSLNIPLLYGIAEAARKTIESRDFLSTEVCYLRNRFEEQIKEKLPASQLLFQEENRLCNFSCIAFPQMFAESFLFLLERKGLLACDGGENMQNISDLLDACGIILELKNNSLSFCFSRFNQESEISRAVSIIEQCFQKLSSLSVGVFL